MNKPLTMVIKETEKKIADACNESGLSPAILDLIVRRFYSEIHSLAERQSLEEEMAYAKMVREITEKANNADTEN